MNNDQIISEVRNESMLNKKQDRIIMIDDTIIKKYININLYGYDNDYNNLNIDYISKHRGFPNLINRLLYEVYVDYLNDNEDKTMTGIVGIFTPNEYTNWSILNYFGGHKFVKDILIQEFKNDKTTQKTPKEFYRWLITNKSMLFGEKSQILKKLVRTNLNTFNKGTKTELFLTKVLKESGFDVKYFPPGSTYDRKYGIDLIINNTSYQIKELVGIEELNDGYYLKTPLPKEYKNLNVKRIMLVDINNGEFVSFPNKDYVVSQKDNAFIVDKSTKLKVGNIFKL
jgi:hypothetical protein